MKIYLCARYSRREEMRLLRDELHRRGQQVVSGWIDSAFPLTNQGSAHAPPEQREACCLKDIADLLKAECVISFTEEPRSNGRGGRHVEFGMAIAWGKALVVVGHRENVFHHHPLVQWFVSVEDMLRTLFEATP